MGQTTLIDLMTAVEAQAATLQLKLEAGGQDCTVTVEWEARPIAASLPKRDEAWTPHKRMLSFTGSMKDVVDTLIAWTHKELPMTFLPPQRAEVNQ